MRLFVPGIPTIRNGLLVFSDVVTWWSVVWVARGMSAAKSGASGSNFVGQLSNLRTMLVLSDAVCWVAFYEKGYGAVWRQWLWSSLKWVWMLIERNGSSNKRPFVASLQNSSRIGCSLNGNSAYNGRIEVVHQGRVKSLARQWIIIAILLNDSL